MRIRSIPFGVTDWKRIAPTLHPGDRGTATWRTKSFGVTRLHDGTEVTLRAGTSYEIVDNSQPYSSFTDVGALLYNVE